MTNTMAAYTLLSRPASVVAAMVVTACVMSVRLAALMAPAARCKFKWSIKAAGPEGTNRVLFVVSQSPRDPKIFALDEVSGGGPFAFSLAEMTARKRLVDFFLGRGIKGKNGLMAASLVSVAEVP